MMAKLQKLFNFKLTKKFERNNNLKYDKSKFDKLLYKAARRK